MTSASMVKSSTRPRESAETKSSRGRPAKSMELSRCKRIVALVTPEEQALMKHLADRQGVSVSTLCREFIISGLEHALGDATREKKEG